MNKLLNKSCASIFYNKLVEHNVKNVWLYSGGAIMPIVDAFHNQNKINYFVNCHEQSAGHAATGYAKSSNETGVVIVTSGPGLTNLVTPILDATNDSTPLVVFSGQVSQNTMGSLAFQECPATDITKSITKWSYCVKQVEEIPDVIDMAFQIANDGKKGAVHIDLPKCVTSGTYINKPYIRPKIKLNNMKNEINIDYVKHIANIINESEKPVLYVGKGCNNYSELLREFAMKANIPVTTTLHAMGVFDETHHLSLKMVGMHGSAYANYSIQESDCIIALGSRFDDRTTGDIAKYAPNTKNIIHVNINKEEINKIIHTNHNIHGDCGEFLESIIPYIKFNQRENWIKYICHMKFKHPFEYIQLDTNIKTQSVLIEMNKQIEILDDVIISTGVGNHMMMACQFIDWKYPNRILASGSLGVMGCSTGYAMGAKIANPESIVISVDGDGSFNMTSNELKTLVEYNIPIKIALMNDNSLQMVKIWEELFFDKRVTATDNNHNPDYVQLAKAYGLEAMSCDNYYDLPFVMRDFLRCDKPVLCEFKVERDICLPLVGPGKALDDMILFHDYYNEYNDMKLDGITPS